jgi:hypothetical protein
MVEHRIQPTRHPVRLIGTGALRTAERIAVTGMLAGGMLVLLWGLGLS